MHPKAIFGLGEPAEPNGFSIMMGPASPHGRCKRKPFIAWAIDLQNMQSCSPLRRNSLSSERIKFTDLHFTRSFCQKTSQIFGFQNVPTDPKTPFFWVCTTHYLRGSGSSFRPSMEWGTGGLESHWNFHWHWQCSRGAFPTLKEWDADLRFAFWDVPKLIWDFQNALIEESTKNRFFFGFDGKVALQTLFLRLLLERSFTELGAPWLQKKTLSRYTRYTSWSLIQVRTGLSVSGGCCSTGSFNVQGGLRNAWNTLMSLDLWGFNSLLWMECGWELSLNAGKTLSALPVVCHGKVQHYHTGLLREIAFYIQEEPLAWIQSNLKCSK